MVAASAYLAAGVSVSKAAKKEEYRIEESGMKAEHAEPWLGTFLSLLRREEGRPVEPLGAGEA